MLRTFKLDEYSITKHLEYQTMISHRYAIIEPSLFDDLLVYVYQQNPVLEWDYLLGHELKKRSPIIIKLTGNESHDDFLNRFIAQPSGSLFSSSLDFKAFQQQAFYAYTIIKESGNKATLRFFDPRVLPSVLLALKPEQRDQMFHGVFSIQWHHYNSWFIYQSSAPSGQTQEIQRFNSTPIVIDNAQLALMDEIRKSQLLEDISHQYQPILPPPHQAMDILLDADKYNPTMAQEYEGYLRMRIDTGCLEKEPQWMSIKLEQSDTSLTERIKRNSSTGEKSGANIMKITLPDEKYGNGNDCAVSGEGTPVCQIEVFDLGWMQADKTQTQEELFSSLYTEETLDKHKDLIKKYNTHLNEPVRQGEIIIVPTMEPVEQEDNDKLIALKEECKVASEELCQLTEEQLQIHHTYFEVLENKFVEY